MPKRLKELAKKYLEAEKQLEIFITVSHDISISTLREIDAKVSTAFDDLLNASFSDPNSYLERAKFLNERVRILNTDSNIVERMAKQITEDLDRFEHLKQRPNVQLASEMEHKARSGQQLLELCYNSVSVTEMDSSSLEELREKAREYNADHSISGLLTYDESTKRFFQILEGPENEVRRLTNKIINDQRHRDIEVLFITPIRERVFAHWSMGFITTNQIKSELGSQETVSDWMDRKLGKQSQIKYSPGQKWLIESFK